MHVGNANLWRFFCGGMLLMSYTQRTKFSSSKLVSELHKKSHNKSKWKKITTGIPVQHAKKHDICFIVFNMHCLKIFCPKSIRDAHIFI
jgi:hypothetical protein